jgi:hypothetical protein
MKKLKRPESLHDQIANKCIHFNGMINEVCEAGIRYKDINDLPCVRESVEAKAEHQCPKCEWPTEEYIENYLAIIAEADARMEKATDLCNKIKTEQKGKNWQGIEVCPACGGKLHLSHAGYNGHLWGRCETAGCLAWIE